MIFTDGDNKMWFEDKLTSLPTSEATYLLTTFANMARARPSHETEFIEAITGEIYEVSHSFNTPETNLFLLVFI